MRRVKNYKTTENQKTMELHEAAPDTGPVPSPNGMNGVLHPYAGPDIPDDRELADSCSVQELMSELDILIHRHFHPQS